MRLLVKETFNYTKYRSNTFEPYNIYFGKGKSYSIEDRGKYLLINGCQFSINAVNEFGELYVYDYFYSEKECRKLKLKSIGYGFNSEGDVCSG